MTYLSPPAFHCRNADLKILCIIASHFRFDPSLPELALRGRVATAPRALHCGDDFTTGVGFLNTTALVEIFRGVTKSLPTCDWSARRSYGRFAAVEGKTPSRKRPRPCNTGGCSSSNWTTGSSAEARRAVHHRAAAA